MRNRYKGKQQSDSCHECDENLTCHEHLSPRAGYAVVAVDAAERSLCLREPADAMTFEASVCL